MYLQSVVIYAHQDWISLPWFNWGKSRPEWPWHRRLSRNSCKPYRGAGCIRIRYTTFTEKISSISNVILFSSQCCAAHFDRSDSSVHIECKISLLTDGKNFPSPQTTHWPTLRLYNYAWIQMTHIIEGIRVQIGATIDRQSPPVRNLNSSQKLSDNLIVHILNIHQCGFKRIRDICHSIVTPSFDFGSISLRGIDVVGTFVCWFVTVEGNRLIDIVWSSCWMI